MLLILIFFATLSYTLFDIFASRASTKMDVDLSTAIINGVAVVLPLLLYVYLRATKAAPEFPNTPAGIGYSIAAGISVTIFSILLLLIFQKGEGLSYVVPLVYGGTILLASLFGWLFFKESVNLLEFGGIVCILVGVIAVVYSKVGSIHL